MVWVPGQTIQNGKYTIEHQPGAGGFGITYLATTQTGQQVVIKTPNDFVNHHAHAAKLQQDFLNEALRLALCRHPHVVQVKELIREGMLDGMVMEYIEGQSLLDRLAHQGKLPETVALNYIRQIGAALTVVHQQGLLHRDIKPENIMVRSHIDQAVLIDFGIAREFMPNLTQTQTQMLTHGYAPIEQYDRHAKRGAYTDVYALAVTLYVLLTGQRPLESQSRALEMFRYRTDPLLPVKQLNPGVSDRTNQAIWKGMAIEPHDPPQTMLERLRLLEPPKAPPAPTPVPAPVPVPAKANPAPTPSPVRPQSAPSVLPQPSRLNRKGFLKWVGLGGGGLLLAVVGRSLWEGGRSQSSISLEDFNFEVVTVNEQGQETNKETKQAQRFVEDLGNGVTLEMVAIPGGTFEMGSPAEEKDRNNDESPQHTVTVPGFFMGRYEVTHAQYEAIVGNNPSRFKGANRPVEQVSWHEAQEFCQRLSQRTGR
jgi:serine/threonine protein kinase